MATTDQPIGILGTGSYLPERVVANEEIGRLAGVTSEWIEQRTRIRARRYAAADEATSDLATRAAASALAQAHVDAGQLDYLVVATSTPDSPQPPTAALVQHALGAVHAACVDVNAVCSGFVYALAVANALLRGRPDGHALVVAADVYSRILDTGDRTTAVLFGDGAGAVVLGPVRTGRGIVAVDLRTRGDAHELIGVAAGGSRRPPTHDTVDAGEHYFRMDGHAVRDFVLAHVPPALDALLNGAGIAASRVDHLVPHQPNGALLDRLIDKTGMGAATTHRTLERYGNVGAASIPITLDDANRAGLLRDGDTVVLAGFGGGMAIGSCLLLWSA